MVVRDKGSLLNAENCRVKGAEPCPHCTLHALALPSGVLVYMGARLELSRTCIDNVGRGVTVCQSSAAVLTDCNVERVAEVPSQGMEGCGILSFDSNVELSRCVFYRSNESSRGVFGVYARNSSVKLQGCRVLRSKVGVMLYRSQGVLADCDFASSGEMGVFAGEHSSLDMQGCMCSGTADCGVQV